MRADTASEPDSIRFIGLKIKGIIQRGKIYCLRTRKNGGLLRMSFETEDCVEAVNKAALKRPPSELHLRNAALAIRPIRLTPPGQFHQLDADPLLDIAGELRFAAARTARQFAFEAHRLV